MDFQDIEVKLDLSRIIRKTIDPEASTVPMSYVVDKKGNPVLILQGKVGSTKLKVTIKKANLAKAKTLAIAETRVQCQLTKYQMCLGCKACESVCKHNAITVRIRKDTSNNEDNDGSDINGKDTEGELIYQIDDEKCVRCTECVNHFTAGCYMRKVLGIRRTQNG